MEMAPPPAMGDPMVITLSTKTEPSMLMVSVLWDTPIGGIWGRSTDETLLRYLLGEQRNRGVYLNDFVNVADGDVVFDVGSHLGTFTRAALDRGARVVVAFEPEPTNIACFEKTFARDLAEGRVILVEAAVSEAKSAVESGDAERIMAAKASLTAASHELSTAMYAEGAPAGAGAQDPAGEPEADDGDVIDAEFEEKAS